MLPARACQRLAALSLLQLRAHLQRPHRHAAGAAPAQRQMARLPGRLARFANGARGGQAGRRTPQHSVSLAPPLPRTGQARPARTIDGHRRSRRAIFARIAERLAHARPQGAQAWRPGKPSRHFPRARLYSGGARSQWCDGRRRHRTWRLEASPVDRTLATQTRSPGIARHRCQRCLSGFRANASHCAPMGQPERGTTGAQKHRRRHPCTKRECLPQPIRAWLARFHGVVSNRLPNYLGWRWALDGERITSVEQLLRIAFGVINR